MATGDMDKDGYEDIVIGAPGYSVKGSPQQGKAIALKQDIAINITSSHFPYRRYDNQNHQPGRGRVVAVIV
jgi:hypothetical protein